MPAAGDADMGCMSPLSCLSSAAPRAALLLALLPLSVPAPALASRHGAHPASATPTVVRRTVPLGSAVLGARGWDASYLKAFLAHYDSLTPENAMKMDALQPRRGSYVFKDADTMTNWALSNGKSVHGHTLIWGNQLPLWMKTTTWDRDSLLAVLRDHVSTVVGHFRGRVGEWDVVNEPLDAAGRLEQSVWASTIGFQYIEDALKAAHAADPQAKLFINEQGIEAGPKADAMLWLLWTLIQRGAPIDGVGIQMHTSTASYAKEADIAATMRRYASLGLKVEITEMDVRTSTTPGTVAQKLAAQADAYGKAARACNEVSACTRFATWGFTDSQSWLGRAEMGLPFDASFRPKPAWTAITSAFAQR